MVNMISQRCTFGSSSMAEMRSESRSKQSRASGGCCAAETTIDSSCATRTPNLERGTLSLTYFFAMKVAKKKSREGQARTKLP